MLQGIAGLLVFVDSEKIFPLSLRQLNLQLIIAAKVKTQPVVQLPDQLIAFYGGDNADQPGVFKEPVGHILYVQL